MQPLLRIFSAQIFCAIILNEFLVELVSYRIEEIVEACVEFVNVSHPTNSTNVGVWNAM